MGRRRYASLLVITWAAYITDSCSFFTRITALRRGREHSTEGLLSGVPPEEAQAIEALRSAVGTSGMEPLADPLTLLRFYRARNRNVDAAAEMYRTTLAWRSEPFDQASIGDLMDAFGTPGQYHEDGSRSTSDWTWSPHPNTLEAELAYRHAFFTRLPNQHVPEPILVWRAGHADYQGIVREDLVEIMIKAFVVHLEDALQASRTASLKSGKLVRARLIIDCDGFGFENVRYIPILKRIIALGKSYYPEVAATVTVIRAPAFLATFYKLVKPFLPNMLQQKICILNGNFHDGLKKHTGLDVASLPDFLGGNLRGIKFGEVLPVPSNALNFLCQS
ncbi:CRAL-TRIO domain-containing protein T23G5.2 [Durusdinium trenchii]|uniref:CRAL-TRIO domain-containing protein T23G5.2 n=2 Tax=Durusdinium trenchii TaxID=1381693 RepID=A0ABP0ISW7_9DINO